MAIYLTVISVGFAFGPGMIWLFGFTRTIPFYLIAIFLPIAALPIYKLRKYELRAKFSSGGSSLLLIRRVPAVASAWIVVSGFDLALTSLVRAMVAQNPRRRASFGVITCSSHHA